MVQHNKELASYNNKLKLQHNYKNIIYTVKHNNNIVFYFINNIFVIPHICKLSVLVLNCQSIVSKKADLNCLIETTNPDIIIASETWLKPSINSSEFLPQNYIVYRKDREDGYGGVLLAHKITLTSHQLHIDSLCELVACKFDQTDNPLVICSVYRPPSSNIEYLDCMCKDLQSITLTNPSSTMWIGGDLNLPDMIINWSLNAITGHQYSLFP